MLIGETLVQTDGADFIAVNDGDWSSGATWRGGAAPTGDSNVFIPEGRAVEISDTLDSTVKTVNVEGALSFANDEDTRLNADTIRVGSTGRLQVGSSNARVQAANKAEIVFDGSTKVGADGNDPNSLGKGLLVSEGGQVEFYGAEKTPYAAISNTPGNEDAVELLKVGSSEITLDTTPEGWRQGDEIVLTAADFKVGEDPQSENFTIRQLNRLDDGRARLQLGSATNPNSAASLKYDHQPIAGKQVHVGNLTRNVVLRSESDDVDVQSRGHVMAQSFDAVFDNTEFRDLGRTDKKLFAEDGTDVNGDGLINQRGRYALHFHRNLDAPGASAENAAVVTGSVANSGPGWGFVSHSSNADFTNNVSYNFDGAAFAAEAGDEIGTWDGNLATQGQGDGSFSPRRFEDAGASNRVTNGTRDPEFSPGTPFRISNGDLGFAGDGFWLQSPGIEVTNNIASGFAGRGFNYWTQGLYETDRQEEAGFRTEYIDWDNSYRTWKATKGNDGTTPGAAGENIGRAVIGDLSLNKFEGNQTYGSRVGVQLRFHNHPNRNFAHTGPGPLTAASTQKVGPGNNFGITEVSNFDAWNTQFGLGSSYVSNLRVKDSSLTSEDGDTAFYQEHTQAGTNRYENVTVDGYRNGLNLDKQTVKFSISDSEINTDANGYGLRWNGRNFGAENLPTSDTAARNA